MAFSPLAATHYREAQNLYRRRQQLLDSLASPREALRQLDWRLLANLQGAQDQCTGVLNDNLKPAELFVESWWLLHGEQAEEGLMQLDALFPALDAEQQQALIASIQLAVGLGYVEVNQPALQATLCSRHPQSVASLDLFCCADEVAAVALQLQDADGAGSDVFRPFYQEQERARTRRQALISGLIRRDAAAFPVARDYPDDPVLTLLLVRSGEAGGGPMAQALMGTEQAANALLAMMEQVEMAQQAATAWVWLCGTGAPRKPRLQAVGDSATSSQTLPDAAAARQHWQVLLEHREQKGLPVFFGQTRTESSIADMTDQWCGQVSALIAAHRAFDLDKSAVPADGWQHHALHGDSNHV